MYSTTAQHVSETEVPKVDAAWPRVSSGQHCDNMGTLLVNYYSQPLLFTFIAYSRWLDDLTIRLTSSTHISRCDN